MAKCPACQAHVSKTDSFCPMCGSILEFGTSGAGVNRSTMNYATKQMPKFDHIPDPRYTTQYHRVKTKKKSKAPIIAFVVAFMFLIIGVGGFIFLNLFNDFDSSINEEPVYVEEKIDPLVDQFPQYEDELIKLQNIQQSIQAIYDKYDIDDLDPTFSVVEEVGYESVRLSHSGFFGDNGYVTVDYDVLSGYYSVGFNGEELGTTFNEMYVDLNDYPIFLELINLFAFEKQDYYEAVAMFDPSLPLEEQEMSVNTELDNGENACYVWCFDIYNSEDYYFMISYAHYEW